MGHAYRSGLAAALRRWPVVLVFFVVNLCAGLCFTAAGWSWLLIALDKSLAGRTLLTNLDMNVFIDLVAHHSEGLLLLMLVGVMLAAVFCLLSVWLNAVAMVALGESDAPLAECLHRALGLYPTYFRLFILANVMHAVSVAAAFLLARGLMRWTAESASETAFYWAVASGVGVGALLLLFFVTVHDHARVHSAATGAGALRAYGWALAYVARREWRALPLAVFLFGTGVVLWGVYQFAATLVSTNSAGGVTISLVWGETFLLARMLLRVWVFAAETDLQNLSERTLT